MDGKQRLDALTESTAAVAKVKRRTRRFGPIGAVTAIFLATALLGGCGRSASNTSEMRPAALSIEIVQTESGRYEFRGDRTVEAGLVTLRLKNSTDAYKNAQVIRLEGSRNQSDLIDAFGKEGPFPTWVRFLGGPAVVHAGETVSATVALPAGEYFVVDPEGDATTPSRVTKGALLRITSEGSGSTRFVDAKPTVTAREGAFEVPRLAAGRQQVRFHNAGREVHAAVIAKIADGKSIDDVREDLAAQLPPGDPSIDFDALTTQAIGILDGGETVDAELDLVPGNYAFICFMQDRAGGPPHFVNGMLQPVTVS